MAAKTAAASDETARKTEEGRVLNEWDMAALCGYCCVDNPELCPPIYKTLRHVKNVEDARQVLTKSMEDWAERRPRRIDIDRGVFLSEEVIKNIMKVTPNPGGVVATAEPSDKIVSNL
jgi:ribonuclease D